MTWHIVYLSYESKPNGRNYIGKHSTSNLYDNYLGSFSDNSFFPDSKIILGFFSSAEAAVQAEIQWQRVFNVVSNPEFANRSYQTSIKFDITGLQMTDEYKSERSERYSGDGNPNFGKTTPKHVREKISKSLKGRTQSEKRKRKQAEVMRGNSYKKDKPQPPEAIEAARLKNIGRKNTPETIQKMSVSAKRSWEKRKGQQS